MFYSIWFFGLGLRENSGYENNRLPAGVEYSLLHETAHEQKKSMIFSQVTFLSKIYKNTLLKYEKNCCTYLRLYSSRHLSEITPAESINQTANGTKNVWHVMFDVICTTGIRHDCHDNAPVIWNPRFRHWGILGANQGFSPRFQLDWVPPV